MLLVTTWVTLSLLFIVFCAGIPAPVSYVPTIEENDNSDQMSFWDRAFNLYMYLGTIAIHRKGTDLTTEVSSLLRCSSLLGKVFRRHVSPNFPNVREIAANSSLCFVNADEMFDLPRPIIHKTIYIGGLGVKKPQPLSQRFNEIMEKGRDGLIIFSLGSIAQFHALDETKKGAIASLIRRMANYHFLVKISKGFLFLFERRRHIAGDTVSNKYFSDITNVDLVEWLPQNDILAHPRIKLFIMHGGLNGLTEALLRGVPVIVIPIFADQFRNARNVERRGVGKVLLLSL